MEEPDNPQHPVDLLNRADAVVAMGDAVVDAMGDAMVAMDDAEVDAMGDAMGDAVVGAMDDAEVDAMDGAMGDAVVAMGDAMDGADNMLPHSSNYLHWDFDPLAFWRMSP
ncbi:hypothetical protein PACILC2_42850 [Paenibacillus cisolokensis]|uniref:Uncharacterized protein n=1 Tax=Paenibacillus cisolokensis TaxID=1658519 RepID=A0ABQ4NBW9_9BACL|nr:hypothetical protein PACILC2_42850 [Paenibacillus cisolokensis]